MCELVVQVAPGCECFVVVVQVYLHAAVLHPGGVLASVSTNIACTASRAGCSSLGALVACLLLILLPARMHHIACVLICGGFLKSKTAFDLLQSW